jgi:hypothetical protein
VVEQPPSLFKPGWQKYGTPLIVLLLPIAIIVSPRWSPKK